MRVRVCELCNGEAALYCPSDSAFLCWNCDSKVHGANFLVARHVRRPVCSKCKGFTGNRISGARLRPFSPICGLCSPVSAADDQDSLSSSLSSPSACISSTERCSAPSSKIDFDRLKSYKIVPSGSSSVTGISDEGSKTPAKLSSEVTSTSKMKQRPGATRKPLRWQAQSNVDRKAEIFLVNWCRKLGLSGGCELRRARRVLCVCSEELTSLPLSVSVAASLWVGLRSCEDRLACTWQVLKRLSEISGVPAKLIVAAESKLSRALRARKPRSHQQEAEGWAEC